MDELLQLLLARLRDAGIPQVCPAFDAVPVCRKSSDAFTVLTVQSMEFGDGFPAEHGIVHPFTAAIRAELLAPMETDAQKLMQRYFQEIVPAMLGTDCLFLRFDTGMPRVDAKLQKLVFGGEFHLHGTFCTQEGEESA